jgi:multiple sugar transport system permease protein
MNAAGQPKQWAAYWFIAPYFSLFALFLLLPLGFGLVMGFFQWELASPLPPQFIGLGNFRELWADPYFIAAAKATARFTLFLVPLTVAMSLGLAVGLASLKRGMTFFRAVIYVPTLLNVAVAGILWKWFLSADFGLFNSLLTRFGVPGIGWLTEANTALPSVVIMTLWWTIGGPTIILLAGVQAIPATYYEAALIDGASAWRQFRHITLPLLRPVLTFVVVMNVIGSFQVFGQTYILTPTGGPGLSTLTLVQYIYQTSFENYRLGYGAAMSGVLLCIIVGITLVQLKLLGRLGSTS